jgi:drug/metabolite transporter superfamily protein YnfA
MNVTAWIVFVWAAVLEVGGDALIRKGLRTQGLVFILLGFLALGCYGLVVNIVRWDFSKLLGVYISFFALASVLAGRYLFKESLPYSTWLGLGIIMVGGMIIQFGSK